MGPRQGGVQAGGRAAASVPARGPRLLPHQALAVVLRLPHTDATVLEVCDTVEWDLLFFAKPLCEGWKGNLLELVKHTCAP